MVFGRIPRRLRDERSRYALVDGIPFQLPVTSSRLQALMVGFSVDADAARELLPAAVAPARLWDKAVLMITVVNYEETVIGKYIEFSVALACVRRSAPPPRLLPFLLQGPFKFGQYVLDLPVSTEISVKGGKGIWGMPKHRASLDFTIRDDAVSSQYDDDGQLAVYVEIARPHGFRVPLSTGASNYCQFRGMLMKSDVYFHGKAEVALGRRARGRLELGELRRLQPLQSLSIGDRPIFTIFIPEAHGVLDDHAESWFLTFEQPPIGRPEGMESVVDLGLGEDWLPPPRAPH